MSQGINISNYNEMLRYEKDMDLLRALALYATSDEAKLPIPAFENSREYVFDLIKFYTGKFALDIYESGCISSGVIDTFHSALFSVNRVLGITQQDIIYANKMQRYATCGFWEMRRYIGQFQDIAELIKEDGITHIVSAAVSGCIVAEYLRLVAFEKYSYPVPVDHMIFVRENKDPVHGLLPNNTSIAGNKVLLVDDAVMETVTAKVMTRDLKAIYPEVSLSLFTVDIEPEVLSSGYLGQFEHVYLFDE